MILRKTPLKVYSNLKRHADNSGNQAGLWILKIAIAQSLLYLKFLLIEQHKVLFRNEGDLKKGPRDMKRTANAQMSRTAGVGQFRPHFTKICQIFISKMSTINDLTNQTTIPDVWYHGLAVSIECLQTSSLCWRSPWACSQVILTPLQTLLAPKQTH